MDKDFSDCFFAEVSADILQLVIILNLQFNQDYDLDLFPISGELHVREKGKEIGFFCFDWHLGRLSEESNYISEKNHALSLIYKLEEKYKMLKEERGKNERD